MDTSSGVNTTNAQSRKIHNQNIQVYVRVRPLNSRERFLRSSEVVEVISGREILTRHTIDSKLTKKFTFDRTFGPDSRQSDVYATVVAPFIDEVLAGYNCTVFAYGQTGTGKTHTMVGSENAALKSSWEDDSDIGIIPRALCHLFDELRLMELEFSMRISYLELYNEELCDLLSSDDTVKIRIFDDSTKKGSVIIQGLEEISVHSKDDVYKLLQKGKERRKTAATLMNAQSSRSHTVFSIVVHIRENGIDGEEMLKIGKLNLVDLAGSENVSKAGNEKAIRVRETVNINQSLLTLGRVITALVERTPHIPYRESKLTRLLQESLGGRTKTSIIATISPGHKDIEETLSTLEYAHRARNIQNKPEVNQKLTKKIVLKEYTEEIDKLKRDLMAARDKNGIYLAEDTYNEMTLKMDSQNRELNEKVLLLKALKDELQAKEKAFVDVSVNLVKKSEELRTTSANLLETKGTLGHTEKVLQRAKRLYQENKILLKSHVETEEKLITQANQVVEVADIATDDTAKLHNIIQKRKDVDLNINSVCTEFSHRIKEKFSKMNTKLDEHICEQKNFVDMFKEEIVSSTKLQAKILDETHNRVESLQKFGCSALDTALQTANDFNKKLQECENDRIIAINNHTSNILDENKNMKIKFDNTINQLELEVRKQEGTLGNMRKAIGIGFQQKTANSEKFCLGTINSINSLKNMLENNFVNAISKIKMEMNKEQELRKKQQKLLQAMFSIDEEREAIHKNISNRLIDIEEFRVNLLDTFEKETANVMIYMQDERGKNKHYDNVYCGCIDKAEDTLNNTHVLAENIRNDIYTHMCDAYADVEKINQMDTKHTKEVQTLIENMNGELKDKSDLNKGEIGVQCSELEQMIKINNQRVNGYLAVAVEMGTAIEDTLNEYKINSLQCISECVNDVETFQTNELKTYKSTGTTPSKRDYIYPRVFNPTIPHTDILNHIRQKGDLGDLEITRIDEDSFSREGTFVEKLNEDVILNSTPKSENYQKSSQLSVNNILKESQNNSLSVSGNGNGIFIGTFNKSPSKSRDSINSVTSIGIGNASPDEPNTQENKENCS